MRLFHFYFRSRPPVLLHTLIFAADLSLQLPAGGLFTLKETKMQLRHGQRGAVAIGHDCYQPLTQTLIMYDNQTCPVPIYTLGAPRVTSHENTKSAARHAAPFVFDSSLSPALRFMKTALDYAMYVPSE